MSKLLEDFNFNFLGNYDVLPIKEYINSFSDEWFIDTSRQDVFHAHKDTNSYFIYKTNLGWKQGEYLVVEQKSNDNTLLDMINPIITDLELKHHGIRSNVLLIKLKAGHNISAHSDSGEYLISSRRHHIPIITSDQTFFTVGSEKINMAEGECWEINNSRVHAVENNSKNDRIHLLIDIMPNEELGKK
jgi:hypothetical protein